MSTRGRKSKRKTKLPNRYKDTDCELLKNRNNDTTSENVEIEETVGKQGDNVVVDSKRSKEGNDNHKDGEECLESNVSGVMGDKECLDDEFPTLTESIRRKGVNVDVAVTKLRDGSIVDKSSGQAGLQKGSDTAIVMTSNSTVSDTVPLSTSNNDNVNNGVCNENISANREKMANSNIDISSRPKSFVDVTKSTTTEYMNKLSLIPVEIEEGREVVIFDEDLVMEGSRKWMLTLCGHFVGCKMSYYELKYNISRMWGRFGLKDIVVHNGLYLFKFRELEGMNHVLESGPWLVNNKPLMVQKWDPSVIIDRRDPEVLPCWIKLHNVPVEAWTVKGISAIASSLGNPLIMDKTTARMCSEGTGNIGFARVLVEIKADREFKEKIEICYKDNGLLIRNSKFVNVEYSWKPPRCSHCKVYGHTDSTCGMNVRKEDGKNESSDKNSGDKDANKSEGFNKVKQGNGNKGAKMNKGTKGARTRMEFRPVMKKPESEVHNQSKHNQRNEVNMQNNKDTVSTSSPVTTKSTWKVDKNAIEELKRSANKYAVLEEIEGHEIYGAKWKDSIDKFVKNQRQPSKEEAKLWTEDMQIYFNEQWKEIWDKECSEEEDVYDDDSGIAKSMTANELSGNACELLNGGPPKNSQSCQQ